MNPKAMTSTMYHTEVLPSKIHFKPVKIQILHLMFYRPHGEESVNEWMNKSKCMKFFACRHKTKTQTVRLKWMLGLQNVLFLEDF